MSQVGEGEKNSKLGHISSERDLHLRVGESDNVVITLIWGVKNISKKTLSLTGKEGWKAPKFLFEKCVKIFRKMGLQDTPL